VIAILVIGGIAITAILAIVGKMSADSAANSAVTGGTVARIPNPLATAVPDDASRTDSNIGSTSLESWRSGGITTDVDTWPSGDAIWDICRAIAKAEGYNTQHAAFRLNNPGDISDGAKQYGSEFSDGSNITHFPDAATGWNWLYNKISNHINGKSSTYPANLTITQVAQKWAGQWQNWKTIVGQELQVDPDSTTFAGYVGV